MQSRLLFLGGADDGGFEMMETFLLWLALMVLCSFAFNY